MCTNEYLCPYKGAIGTQSVASGHEYCLQTRIWNPGAEAVSLKA